MVQIENGLALHTATNHILLTLMFMVNMVALPLLFSHSTNQESFKI